MKEVGEAESLPSACASDEGEYLPLHTGQLLSSLPKTFANLVLSIVGSGVLGLPYTFSRVGWVMGILVLAGSGAVSYHGMMLLVYSKRRLRRAEHGLHLVIAGYGDLMYQAFGSWGRLIVDVLLTLGTFACVISYVTFISQNAASIASGLQGTQLSPANVFDVQFTHVMASNIHGSFSNSIINAPKELDLFSKARENLDFVQITHALAPIHHGISPNLIVDAPKKLDLISEAQENHNFMQFSNDNQSDLSSQNQKVAKVSRKEMRTVGFASANLSVSGSGSLDWTLGGVSWLSSSTYTCLLFPLEVALAAIPSVTLLAPFSVVGNTLSFTALVAVMVYDVMTIAKTSSFGNARAFGSMVAVPSAFGVGVYAFQSSGIMIPLEAAMEKPWKLGSVLGLALNLCGVLYVLFAVLGYGAFNEKTQQVITLNLPSGLETMIIKAAICSSLSFSIPLALNPIFELVERRFTRRKASLVLRALVLLAVCLLATRVKQFTVFLSLAGSSISCLLGFILPAVVHLKIIKEDVDNPPSFVLYAADGLLIVFGVIFGAFGTTVSFLELLG